jgi:hypothetical protein
LFLPPHSVGIPELPYPKGDKTKKKSKKSKWYLAVLHILKLCST